MKRLFCILLLAALLLTLCACGRKDEAVQGAELPASVDPKTGEWLGLGGCYRTEPIELPTGAWPAFCRDGELYSMAHKDMGHTQIYRGGQELLLYDGMAQLLSEAEEGFWVQDEEREDQLFIPVLSLYSYSGQLQKTLRLKLPQGAVARGVESAGGFLYLNCSDALRIYDGEGELLAAIPHEEWAGAVLLGGDGRAYYRDQRDSGGGTVSAIDPETGSLRELFSYEKGRLSGGDSEGLFFLILPEGVYRVDAAGETRPLVLWDECQLVSNGLDGIEALDDGRFWLGSMMGTPQLLVPADPSEIKARIMLSLAVLPDQETLDRGGDVSLHYSGVIRSVNAFNAQSQDCCVKLLALSEGGTLSAEQALSRLNARILAGQAPDMLVLEGSLSPFPLIRQGLLRDLREDLETDPDMALEDIVPARAIINDCGGLYVLTDGFSMESRLGLRSRFGEVWGWSFDDYLRIDAETPEGQMVIYNLTRDYFEQMSFCRYLRQAMDWQSCSCDFDNPAFVRVLEACRDMRETPEDPDNMVFGSNLMADGYMATELVMLGDVTALAAETRRIGQPVSVIGWPTPDGSCGTDFGVYKPIGVMEGGAHTQLCWSFLKFLLLNGDSGIPSYRPRMERQLEEARHIDPNAQREIWYTGLTSPISEGEVSQFLELLRRVEHSTLYDETALGILREEAAAFLAGQRSAEEAAARVQSRVSIYMAEQG